MLFPNHKIFFYGCIGLVTYALIFMDKPVCKMASSDGVIVHIVGEWLCVSSNRYPQEYISVVEDTVLYSCQMSPNLPWIALAVILGLVLGGVFVFLIYSNCGVHPQAGVSSSFLLTLVGLLIHVFVICRELIWCLNVIWFQTVWWFGKQISLRLWAFC